ncbi:MAG: hypothetical protein GF388_04485 [Candidatus Aegiribacteria sp.]|nr:hypothetical protein [Candidatus Aegiribacteria sp.]MBD3294493.1 hypothetical protein [Candidatus Fermentibacteria bacterium]
MRVVSHITVSAAGAAAAASISGPSAGLGFLILGGLIDIDHIPIFVSSGLPLNPESILNSLLKNHRQLREKHELRELVPGSWIFPALHSLELIVLLVITGILTESDFLVWGGAGMGLHLLMDVRSYPCSPLFFFITWRLFNWRKLAKAWKVHRSKTEW